MTEITVTSGSWQIDKTWWQYGKFGVLPEECLTGTLDVSTFTAGTHYPNGFIPSGTILGKITATGLYGPYSNAASDGREVAYGILAAAAQVPSLTDNTKDVGCAVQVWGSVIEARLPFSSGAGAIDSNGKADLAGRMLFI